MTASKDTVAPARGLPLARRPYGTTGEQVSILGFGGMRFARPDDPDASAELIRHAHARGVNYFDTAPFYCDDRSEDIFGRALKGLPRDSFHVSTKCSEADGGKLRQSLERSLRRLGLERIDFFHIWCLLQPEALGERIAGGAVAAAQRAQEEGLIRHLVVSAHLAGDDIARVLETGLFAGVTLGYCAINFPYRERALEAALRRRVGVVTMNPLGGGVIPRNAERLSFLRGPEDASVVQAALRFNISHPAVTTALVGFSTAEQVDEAVAAVADFTPYPAEHIARIKANLSERFDGLCTGCGYCLPCPQGLDIPKWMDAYNQRILEGADQATRDRLRWHWSLSPEGAEECIACGQCEEACTQHLPIGDRMAAIAGLAQGRGA